eukprot:TRINITY_DN1067_c0_g1_i1.p1 TRINITY_DN1067_c0_g1~~TRINITY_DN1067_c0_g1_i1.p1  ORF type:complete len:550 (+),score=154.87 TRINITY_DN1067_c0_g1_i1:109-1758(+)
MAKFRQIVLLICLGLFVTNLRADLPVHCLKHQIVGKWSFQVTKPAKLSSGHDNRCGHDEPDNPSTSNMAMKGEFKPHLTFEANIQSDDTVSTTDGNRGKWTMVYDEGFAFNVNQVQYFSFSKFRDGAEGAVSDCSQTLVGWYNNPETSEWGCYRGRKQLGAGETIESTTNKEVKHDNVVQPKDTFTTNSLSETPVEKSSYGFENSDDMSNLGMNDEDNSEPLEFLQLHSEFKDHHKVVERLNKVKGKKWEAHIHPEFAQLTMKELNRRAGRKKHVSFAEVRHFYSEAGRKIDTSDLPSNFDHKQYLGEVREQRDCGSCYAMATMAMLGARLKLKFSEDVVLAPQHVLDCSYYNQGCDGGYPFLVEKFGADFEMVPESCHPYKAKNGRCSDSCDVNSLPKRYKVKEYRFIGGSYGKANEREMMEEIMNKGPIVVSFEPGYDFMMYRKGIYHSVDEASWMKQKLPKPEWEKVDHSVLCYGWGEENGEKYWLLQNTWGPQWGEDGFFRMRRGTDESAIESLAESADPYVVEGGNSFAQVNDSTRHYLRFNKD